MPQVEAILSLHPGVSNAVVFGIPNHRLTEIVVACVYLRENWKWIYGENMNTTHLKELSSETLKKHCMQKNLTRYQLLIAISSLMLFIKQKYLIFFF